MALRISWIIHFLLGVAFLAYAYFNLIVIPGIDPADPNMGWAWLTTDPDVIEYIKFWFQNLGYWVLALAIMTITISVTGYRKGEKWAWYCLLYIPIHVVIFLFIMPWTWPILGTLIVLSVAGLCMPIRAFFP